MLLRSGHVVEYRPVPSRRSWQSELARGLDTGAMLPCDEMSSDPGVDRVGGDVVSDEELVPVDLDENLPPIIPIEQFELEPVEQEDASSCFVLRHWAIFSVFGLVMLVALAVLLYLVFTGNLLCFICSYLVVLSCCFVCYMTFYPSGGFVSADTSGC